MHLREPWVTLHAEKLTGSAAHAFAETPSWVSSVEAKLQGAACCLPPNRDCSALVPQTSIDQIFSSKGIPRGGQFPTWWQEN